MPTEINYWLEQALEDVLCELPRGTWEVHGRAEASPNLQTFHFNHMSICPFKFFLYSFLKAISPTSAPPTLLGRRRWHFNSPSCALSALTATWDVLSLPWKQNHESFSQEMPPNCLHFVLLLFLGKSACVCAHMHAEAVGLLLLFNVETPLWKQN